MTPLVSRERYWQDRLLGSDEADESVESTFTVKVTLHGIDVTDRHISVGRGGRGRRWPCARD